jgi:FkbM family methyltransferase
VRLGSSYGGWWVPRSALEEGGVAYCAGAGEDVTFDLALHAAGFHVRTFDPTPRAIAHVESVRPRDAKFVFVPTGWWESETTLRFYAPRDADHVSHSAVNLQHTDEYFVAAVKTVAEHARDIGDSRIDLIKMDVEGAETRVIRSLLEHGPLPRVLCVEFDQPQPFLGVVAAIRALRSSGYRVAKIDRWGFTFVRSCSAVLREVP